MPNIIECSDLHVRYRAKNGATVHAVRGLELAVEPGEVVGFLGPNGAGKSSTLKALLGFVTDVSGTCSLFGEPAGSARARQRLGYLPEVALYYPYLTPFETLVLYGELQGLRGRALRDEAATLLEQVGLKGYVSKQNRALSKGMLQRVGIAQALLGSPELLILDEVTSGLDPIGRKELRQLLKEKNQAGTTLFFSSHELSEVAQICDRILLVSEGTVIDEQRLEPLALSLRRHSATFVGNASLHDLTQDFEDLDGGRKRATFATKEDLLAAVERIVQGGGTLLDVVAQEGSLEDYFLATIGAAA